jgi:hypothetical protein
MGQQTNESWKCNPNQNVGKTAALVILKGLQTLIIYTHVFSVVTVNGF